jgi:hypothetical protein
VASSHNDFNEEVGELSQPGMILLASKLTGGVIVQSESVMTIDVPYPTHVQYQCTGVPTIFHFLQRFVPRASVRSIFQSPSFIVRP